MAGAADGPESTSYVHGASPVPLIGQTIGAFFDKAAARWGDGWGIRGVSDLAGLPLLVGLFSVYFFFMTPVINTIIRSNEVEADLFGINASGDMA